MVTNIDNDHLEHYDHDFERLRASFLEFLHHLPFYGMAILCLDNPVVEGLIPEVTRSVVTYGLSPDADFWADNLRQSGSVMRFDAHIPKREGPLEIELSLPGRHNVLNALAAMAVAWELGVDEAAVQRALSSFQGIGRRFNVHGELAFPGGRALFVDDYGHHPTELAATLEAAREGWPDRRLVAVFQPHRYSRTRDLMDDFAQVLSGVDALVLAEVYAAGEPALAGADGRGLSRAIRARGQVDPVFVSRAQDIPAVLPGVMRDGDLVLLLGAGDIGSVAAALYANGFAASAGASPGEVAGAN